jgi:uncharacterized membrane protein
MTAADSPPTRTPRWVQVLLVVSLAANLMVAGLVVGAWLRGGPHGMAGRDPGFGPFAAALSDDDRRALRRAFLSRMPEMRENRMALRRDMQGVLAALHADPFDAAALDSAMDAALARLGDRISVGQSLLVERITAMDSTERTAFADRLETALARGPRHGPQTD